MEVTDFYILEDDEFGWNEIVTFVEFPITGDAYPFTPSTAFRMSAYTRSISSHTSRIVATLGSLLRSRSSSFERLFMPTPLRNSSISYLEHTTPYKGIQSPVIPISVMGLPPNH